MDQNKPTILYLLWLLTVNVLFRPRGLCEVKSSSSSGMCLLWPFTLTGIMESWRFMPPRDA